jgi:hypothetical protein
MVQRNLGRSVVMMACAASAPPVSPLAISRTMAATPASTFVHGQPIADQSR